VAERTDVICSRVLRKYADGKFLLRLLLVGNLPDQLRPILLVLKTDVLNQIVVCDVVDADFDSKRLYIRLRIVEGHLEIHVAEIRSSEPLRHAQRFAVRASSEVQPRFVVEANGVDDERIAVPTAD